MNFISHLKKIDWLILGLAVLLTMCGLVVLYGISQGKGDFSDFYKQIVFLVAGIIIAVSISFLDLKALKESSISILIMYFIFILLLVGLLLFASDVRGTKAWYSFGDIAFQPVELMKIVFIILFAKYFSQRHVEMYQLRHILFSAVYALVPVGLVFVQPDFGSAVILLVLWLSMMLVSGIKRKHLVGIILISILAFLLVWNFMLEPYQKQRFLTFLEPYLGKTVGEKAAAYQISQSKIAIGSGGWFGKGLNEPYTQSKLGFLPAAHTDFIFASFAEFFGAAGAFGLFLIFGTFFWRGLRLAKYCKENFSRLLVSGFVILVGIEMFVNIGINVGILPITGVPLPFLSYGGSSLLSLFIGIGIIESIKVHSDL